MIRTPLTRALATALALAACAGTAQATVHHHPWTQSDAWHFDHATWHDRPDPVSHFRWHFGATPFWERQDRWAFDDDTWDRLARVLCQSLFSRWLDCGGDSAPPVYADAPITDSPAAIPLPAGLPLLGAGLAALALLRRHRGRATIPSAAPR